ncbi:MAG: hypothetical protein WC699_09630 [Bacteroidales bacterium]|jgi:hypothetical protein
MKTVKIFFIVLVSLAAFNSCQKEPIPNPDPKTMDDLVIASTFDWKTTSDYVLTLQGPVNRVVMVTAADGTIYKKGMMVANQPYEVKLTLPAYEKTVDLKYNGQIVELALASAKITYLFK